MLANCPDNKFDTWMLILHCMLFRVKFSKCSFITRAKYSIVSANYEGGKFGTWVQFYNAYWCISD